MEIPTATLFCATCPDGLDRLYASGLGLGAGVAVGAGDAVVGALAGVGVAPPADAVGGTIVGTRAAGWGAPVNKNIVPSTILAATKAFNAKEAYQRQSLFSRLGVDLLGIPVLQIIGRDYTISVRVVKYPATLEPGKWRTPSFWPRRQIEPDSIRFRFELAVRFDRTAAAAWQINLRLRVAQSVPWRVSSTCADWFLADAANEVGAVGFVLCWCHFNGNCSFAKALIFSVSLREPHAAGRHL